MAADGQKHHQQWRPGRLWSLWDLMTPFSFSHILISATMGGMSEVQNEMDRRLFKIPFLSKVSNDLLADRANSFDEFYAELEDLCVQLELSASLATVRKIRQAIAKPGSSHTILRPLQIDLQGRLLDEMLGRFYWSLNVRESELYSHPRKGWEEIIERFPNAETDIEEASKCYALSRYAAAIFHSVQVVEVGLIELGKLIGVTDPISGWTATTNRLHNIIKKGHEARTPFERKHFAFFEQMHGTIEGLKNAWRNKISHAHDRLALLSSEFSPEIAEEILFATRAFMRRLATDAPAVAME